MILPTRAEPFTWSTVVRVALLTAALVGFFWLVGVGIATWVLSRGLRP